MSVASIGSAVKMTKPISHGEMKRYPWRASRRARGESRRPRRRRPRGDARRGVATVGSCSTTLRGVPRGLNLGPELVDLLVHVQAGRGRPAAAVLLEDVEGL